MPSKAMPGLQRVAKADRSKAICQLRVELMHINPLIWRRLLVPYDIKLPKLHECLQMTMGWDDSHLHHFKVGEAVYGLPDPDWQGGEVLDEQRYRLAHLMDDTRREFLYEYDFGDRWEHRVVLEQFDAQSESMTYPICTAGQRACPPEDVGGVPGLRRIRG